MAASIRLRVGLGGALMLLLEDVSSCSGKRVLSYLMILGGGGFLSPAAAVGLV